MKTSEDHFIDLLTFGQLFADELEYFKEHEIHGHQLFRFNLKNDVRKVLNQIRDKVNKIYANIPDKHKEIQAVTYTFDINYELLTELNKLTLEHKKQVLEQLKQMEENV